MVTDISDKHVAFSLRVKLNPDLDMSSFHELKAANGNGKTDKG